MHLEQLDLDWRRPGPVGDFVEVDGRRIDVHYQRNERARRYRLYLDRHGQPRVTIPRRGSQREAREFFAKHRAWLSERLRRFAAPPGREAAWTPGTGVYFRGRLETISVESEGNGSVLRLATELIPAPSDGPELNLRDLVEGHLRKLACAELPPRVLEFAAQHESPVRRVTVRGQRTRWGSCSRRGTVSLNWRLVQVPLEVRDYIILHELMHLREMNHSPRFWAHVARVCPGYEACETWLRRHSREVL